MPDVQPPVQVEFFAALHERLDQVKSLIASTSGSQHLAQETILMLRLLQFGLGFRNVWWSNRRDLSDNLTSLLFKLALVSSFSQTV
jgi:mediator of RNA polymerase II transcription subunit 12